MLKTIINSVTGEELYASIVEVDLAENEIEIEELRTVFMLKPFFNFTSREFYDNATQDELDDYYSHAQ
jgi:uncharacterized membrane protein